MTYLDEQCGKTESPELWAPDIPEDCPTCGLWLYVLEADGTCPCCGDHIEP